MNCTEILLKPKSSSEGLKRLPGSSAPASPFVIPTSREETCVGSEEFHETVGLAFTIFRVAVLRPSKGVSHSSYFLTCFKLWVPNQKGGWGGKERQRAPKKSVS